MNCRRNRGFTLVEVLLAVAIAGAALAVLLTASSRCLSVSRKSKDYQNAQWVLGKGELDYPLFLTNDVRRLEVGKTDYEGGFSFSRHVEDDDDKDGLYVVRTKVTWTAAGGEKGEEIVQYVLQLKQ